MRRICCAQLFCIKTASRGKLFREAVLLRSKFFLSIAGSAAGLINSLFGAGGGMVLVPMLGKHSGLQEEERFPASVAIIAPICIISLLFSAKWHFTFLQFLPYLSGSIIGGIAAGIWGKRIPTVWLHRGLGALILWGGIRYLCPG